MKMKMKKIMVNKYKKIINKRKKMLLMLNINNKFKGLENNVLTTVVVLKIVSNKFKNKKIKLTNKL
jgi:hypothetical protein